MKLTQQLKQTGKQLGDVSTAFVTESRQNTEDLLQRAWDAGATFFEDTRDATDSWLDGTVTATNTLGSSIKKEATTVRKVTKKQVLGAKTSLQLKAEETSGKAKSITLLAQPRNAEKLVLEAVKSFLSKLDARVDSRLQSYEKAPVKGQQAVRNKSKTPKSTTRARATGGRAKTTAEPLRNYDALSARDVVTKLQRLPAPQATAVLRYEKARKKRATVLRAARERATVAT